MAFRSEAHLTRWLELNGHRRGEALSLTEAQALGAAWFGRTLDSDWKPRSTQESQAILQRLGLRGRFWQLDDGT